MQSASVQYSEIIKKLGRDFDNLNPLLQKVCSMVLSSIDDNFAAGGRWDGKGTDITSGGSHKWTPLANSTIKSYKRKGWNNLNATLNRSGSGLRSSVTAKVVNGNSVVIGSNKEYAAMHQFGGTIDYPVRESSAKWRATKNKNGNYQYRFAKSSAKSRNIIERKFKVGGHSVSIPARPFVTLTEKDLNEIVDFLSQFILQN